MWEGQCGCCGRLIVANGRLQASYSAMSVVGPILAGALAVVLPIQSLLVVDAVSYFVSAGALLRVRGSFDSPEEDGHATQRTSIREDIADGLRYVMSDPVLRDTSIMMAIVNFVSMTVMAQLVFFAKTQLHASNAQVGLLFSANAVGILTLALLAGPLRRLCDRAHRQYQPGLHRNWLAGIHHPVDICPHLSRPRRTILAHD